MTNFMSNLENPSVSGLRVLQSDTATWFSERKRVVKKIVIR